MEEGKFMTRKELAHELNISTKTLKRRLLEAGYCWTSGKLLSPDEVLQIKKVFKLRKGHSVNESKLG